MIDLPNWFVVVMGMGTVFISLLFLVLICSILGAVCNGFGKKAEETKDTTVMQTVSQPANNTKTEIPNRAEFVAAVSAAIAEELGTDVTGIRILSIKKL